MVKDFKAVHINIEKYEKYLIFKEKYEITEIEDIKSNKIASTETKNTLSEGKIHWIGWD